MSYEKVSQASRLKIGSKQTTKSVEQGLVSEVIVAKDADPKLTAKIVHLCRKMGVQVVYVDSMKQLGKACGIDVGTAMAAIMSD